MFYESINSLRSDLLKMEAGEDFSFPPHLHGSFELITVTEGEMTVTVDRTPFLISAGDALLIFPNQVHELTTTTHSRHLLCIFSTKLVQAFTQTIRTCIPISNLFTPDPFYLQRLEKFYELKNRLNMTEIKGLLYSLCGEFDRSASYVEKPDNREDLLERIFHFVEINYGRDCSLEALSLHTSYHYVYLSRFFKERTGLSFTDYVNRYRINEAGYLLRNSPQTVLQTALDCGFDSLRSFNRNFKKITGKTPGEYRKSC